MDTNNFKKITMKTPDEFFETFQKFKPYADNLRSDLQALHNCAKAASDSLQIEIDKILKNDPLNFDKLAAPVFEAHIDTMVEIYNINSYIHQTVEIAMRQIDKHVSSIRDTEVTEHETEAQG